MDYRLRPWRIEDKYDLARILNNRRLQDNLRDGIPYPYTADDAFEYINFVLTADRSKIFSFAVTNGDTQIGNVSVCRCENIHFRTAELGYYIGEEYWGKGAATNAVEQICSFVFKNSDILRIFAQPFAFNWASCRVLEKNGFVLEGTLHNNAVKNGDVLDTKMYALIRKDRVSG